jgi:hypothetical protein
MFPAFTVVAGIECTVVSPVNVPPAFGMAASAVVFTMNRSESTESNAAFSVVSHTPASPPSVGSVHEKFVVAI